MGMKLEESIVLYTTNCPQCMMLESQLTRKKIPYLKVTNKDIVMKVAEDNNIMTAPILFMEGVYMDFQTAIKTINKK